MEKSYKMQQIVFITKVPLLVHYYFAKYELLMAYSIHLRGHTLITLARF